MKKIIRLLLLIILINTITPIVYADEENITETETTEEIENPKTGNVWVYVVFGVMFISCAALISSDYFEVKKIR